MDNAIKAIDERLKKLEKNLTIAEERRNNEERSNDEESENGNNEMSLRNEQEER